MACAGKEASLHIAMLSTQAQKGVCHNMMAPFRLVFEGQPTGNHSFFETTNSKHPARQVTLNSHPSNMGDPGLGVSHSSMRVLLLVTFYVTRIEWHENLRGSMKTCHRRREYAAFNSPGARSAIAWAVCSASSNPTPGNAHGRFGSIRI